MKRVMLYIVVLIATLIAPATAGDVGQLQPVQTVAVYRNGGLYVIETDTDDVGWGETLQAAFDHLIASTPADIYLDTAQFLLIAENAESEVEQLRSKMKGSVELYRIYDSVDLQEASKFLEIHGNGPVLKSWKEGGILPVLVYKNGRMILS